MQRKIGDYAISVQVPTIQGNTFNTETLQGKRYMLSFFRFASCPFCNIRMHELIGRYTELDPDFQIVAIFDSSLKNLIKHTAKHQAPFMIGADKDNRYYKSYGIKHSLKGTLKGMVKRAPTLFKNLLQHRHIPLSSPGKRTTMPADILIDEHGIVRTAYYGTDAGDHLPFDQIKAFSLGISRTT